MITARFYTKPQKGSIHMTIRGHAGSAPKGEDLVCAAASMLGYTAAQAVQFLWDTERLKCSPKIELREGDFTVIATPKEEFYAETLHTFWVIQCGAHILAHNYPQYVTLEHMTV